MSRYDSKLKNKRKYLAYGIVRNPEELYKYEKILLFFKTKKSKLSNNESGIVKKLIQKGLVKKIGKSYQTSFPIIDQKKYMYLRKLSKETAKKIINSIYDDILKLNLKLSNYGLKFFKIIFFCLILDDFVFRVFEQKKQIKSMKKIYKTGLKKTFSGYLWRIPIRKDICGTYVKPFNNFEIKQYWDAKHPITIENHNFLNTIKLTKNKDDKIEGKLIFLHKENEIAKLGKEMAKKIAKIVTKEIKSSLKKRLDLNRDDELLCIFYHEIMQDIMAYLNKMKLMGKNNNLSYKIIWVY